MSVRVALIRAGATSYDEENRIQGVLDLPLSARGMQEACKLAQTLQDVELEALYCGPSKHVEATAQLVGQALGLRPRCVEELHNLDHGLWQGLLFEEIKRRNVKLFRQWLEDPKTICPPQGETVEEAMQRLREALRPVLRRHRNDSIGIVVGEPLARILSSMLRGTDDFQLDDQARTAVVEWIDCPDRAVLNGSK